MCGFKMSPKESLEEFRRIMKHYNILGTAFSDRSRLAEHREAHDTPGLSSPGFQHVPRATSTAIFSVMGS